MPKVILAIIVTVIPMFIASQDQQQVVHNTEGKASYYARKFDGNKTANGEIFNNSDYTAAHRTLPFNTYLNVVNKNNNLNVIVRVNDRGPFARNRVIDLSEAAARRIGGYHHGIVPVRVEVLDILHLTPALDSAFHAAPIVDCLGNPSELTGKSISVWSSKDLIHAIYVANDLYIKDTVDQVLIVPRKNSSENIYHVVVTGIPATGVAHAIDAYERKGFSRVVVFKK